MPFSQREWVFLWFVLFAFVGVASGSEPAVRLPARSSASDHRPASGLRPAHFLRHRSGEVHGRVLLILPPLLLVSLLENYGA